MKIGFVILSHSNPAQLLRLIRILQRTYSDPPISCHHDFSQSTLNIDDYPGVCFVTPHIKTKWAQFSVVDASLRAIALLYENGSPDWFYLLSASDYPIRQGRLVSSDLRLSGADALVDFREATYSFVRKPEPGNPLLSHFNSPENNSISWKRFVGINLWVPAIRSGPRIGRLTARFSTPSPYAPFAPSFRCYYGDHWIAGSAKVAKILMNPTSRHLALRRHLNLRTSPDECYYQSVLANYPDLKIDTNTRRFAKWNGGGAHPQILTTDDLPEMLASNNHFARKFEQNDPVLDRIDEFLLPHQH